MTEKEAKINSLLGSLLAAILYEKNHLSTYSDTIDFLKSLSLFSKNNPLVKRVKTSAKAINNPKSKR